jgi:hypothetical protein
MSHRLALAKNNLITKSGSKKQSDTFQCGIRTFLA